MEKELNKIVETADAIYVNGELIEKLVVNYTNGYPKFPIIIDGKMDDRRIAYFNKSKNFVVVLFKGLKDFTSEVHVEKIMDEFKDYAIKRIVCDNYARFIEKICMLEADFNDKIIEVYKASILSENEEYPLGYYDCYFDCSNNLSKVLFFMSDSCQEGDKGFVDFDVNKYNELLIQYQNSPYLVRGYDYIVNEEFAYCFLSEKKDIEPIHLMYIKEARDIRAKKDIPFAVSIAETGDLEKAKEILLPYALEGYEDAQNDIGVVYERMKDYKEAEKWYKKSPSTLSIINLLTLYDNKRVDFDLRDYMDCCDTLIKEKNQNGYLYLSYIHQIDFKGVEDHKKAFQVLQEGILFCKENEKLKFELGYLLEKGIGCEVDNYMSHKCYESILHGGEKVSNYNYALQCYQGRGCERDIKKAIVYFKVAAEQKYKDAIKCLIKIYSSEEFKDAEQLKYYQSMIEEEEN